MVLQLVNMSFVAEGIGVTEPHGCVAVDETVSWPVARCDHGADIDIFDRHVSLFVPVPESNLGSPHLCGMGCVRDVETCV